MSIQPLSAPIELELEQHRRALTGYCYRMLGSGSEAEDAVQETFLRAWRSQEGFEGRASLRSWLYRIATNVCLDMLKGSQRRARPMDLGASGTVEKGLGPPLPETTWVLPISDGKVLPDAGDPAEVAAERETIRLAFVAALQHLPPRQRVVLILREVLRWQASEVAELLDTTTVSVNSALQRARATIDDVAPAEHETPATVEAEQQEMLDKYVDAFQRYDVRELVTLLHQDATFSMPPFDLWLRGPQQVHDWMVGPGAGCADARLRTTRANGRPAVGIYKPSAPGVWEPFNVAVLEVSGGRIVDIEHFLFPELFAQLGLPTRIEE